MKTYIVKWTETVECQEYIEASSEQSAINKARRECFASDKTIQDTWSRDNFEAEEE